MGLLPAVGSRAFEMDPMQHAIRTGVCCFWEGTSDAEVGVVCCCRRERRGLASWDPLTRSGLWWRCKTWRPRRPPGRCLHILLQQTLLLVLRRALLLSSHWSMKKVLFSRYFLSRYFSRYCLAGAPLLVRSAAVQQGATHGIVCLGMQTSPHSLCMMVSVAHCYKCAVDWRHKKRHATFPVGCSIWKHLRWTIMSELQRQQAFEFARPALLSSGPAIIVKPCVPWKIA